MSKMVSEKSLWSTQMQMQQFPLANNEAKKRKNRTAPSAMKIKPWLDGDKERSYGI